MATTSLGRRSARHDVVIVGGGMSGLACAWFLRDRDFLLLEKEDHWGGNAYLEEYWSGICHGRRLHVEAREWRHAVV